MARETEEEYDTLFVGAYAIPSTFNWVSRLRFSAHGLHPCHVPRECANAPRITSDRQVPIFSRLLREAGLWTGRLMRFQLPRDFH